MTSLDPGKVKLVTHIRLEHNISKTAGDTIELIFISPINMVAKQTEITIYKTVDKKHRR